MSFLPRETTLKIDVPTGPVEKLAESIKDVGSEARGASKATEELNRTVRDMPGTTARLPMPRRRDTLDVPGLPTGGGLPGTVRGGPAPATGGGLPGGGGGGGNAMAAVGGLLGGNMGGMLALAGPVGAVAAVALQAASAVKGLADKILHLSMAASPGHAQLFERAMADAQAVVGRFFVPMLQLATDAMRGLGDVLANILPNSSELRTALDPLKQALMELKTVFIDLGPLIRDGIVLQLKFFGAAMKVAAEGLKLWAAPLKGLAGLMGANQNPQSSMGAAPAPAKWLGVEDIGRQAAEAAFSTGIAESDAKNPVPVLERIYNLLSTKFQQAELVAKLVGGVATGAAGDANTSMQQTLTELITFAARHRKRF